MRGRSFATDAAQEVIQFGGQRLVGRNEQLFDAAFQAVVHPFRNVFRIDIGHAPLRVDVNALVDEIHINIVGVGGNRQRTDTACVMRLAVMLAVAPFSNSSRAVM